MQPTGPKYTQAQREAMAAAYGLPGVTGGEVVALAAAGQLMHPSGAALHPFTATQSAVRSEARRQRLRLAKARSKLRLAELPSRDATEQMRCRLADAIEAELERIKIEQAQRHPVRPEELRQLARAVREFCWIPGPNDPRPQQPGAKRDGARQGGTTRGGMGAGILAVAERAHA